MTNEQIEARANELIASGMSEDAAIDQALSEAASGVPAKLSLAERIAAKANNVASVAVQTTKAAPAKAAPAKAKAEKAETKLEKINRVFPNAPAKITLELDRYEYSTGSLGYRTAENCTVTINGEEFALTKANLVFLDSRVK